MAGKKIKLAAILNSWLLIMPLLFFCLPILVKAAENETINLDSLSVNLQVPIAGQGTLTGGLPAYIGLWYNVVIGTSAALATIIIIYAGFRWLTAAGNIATIKDSKAMIGSAVIGLIIALLGYEILYLINPDLVIIRMPGMQGINMAKYSKQLAQVSQSVNITYSGEVPCLGIYYTAANEGFEKRYLTSYQDTSPNHYWTIGVGHKITGKENPPIIAGPGQTISEERAIELLNSDYAKAVKEAKDVCDKNGVDFDSLDDARKIVLIDMAFNMGGGEAGLGGFHETMKAIKNKDWNKAADNILNSGYCSDVKNRCIRNAEMMRTGDMNVAKNYAKNSNLDYSNCP